MPTSKPRSSAPVVPKPLKWHGHIAAWAIFAVLRLNMLTWRVRYKDPAGLLKIQPDKPFLWAIWHNDLAISMTVYDELRKVWRPDTKLAALVSASGDGSLLSRILGLFGVRTVRGSSSRRGAQALLELTSAIDEGFHAAITPDGPRGPVYTVQDGILALAQVTGRPIIPVRVHLSRKTELRSWDRFKIPWPFALCEISLGELVVVPKDAGVEARARLAAELRRRMGQP